MKMTEKTVTIFVLITTALWVIITVLGWKGQHMAGMYLGLVMMLLYMILGVSKQGVVSKKLLFYPLISWGLVWAISFFLADFYALKYAGVMPDFTIMGFHPSFAPIIFLYWIGGMLTLTLGFVVLKDEWMSEEDWDNFKVKIEGLKEEEKRRVTNG